ncbi:hypothetical protein [uncultured Fusobacterium sp.]|jgi:lipoate-protein ligase A|uniref:hypothetical protein n=1 Tax=uncultured Fusobacterium sp. TaxID=159267 RepID=UPI0026601A00|nr:hypothetical protein [uncultured Fusobacterium sp.]
MQLNNLNIDVEKIKDELAEELEENLNLENLFISYEENLKKIKKAVERLYKVTLTEKELLKIDEAIFDNSITITSSNSSVRLFVKNNKIYYILF